MTSSLVDGIIIAGLASLSGGLDSILFWLFVTLIVRNAVSVPPGISQLILNLAISLSYVMVGALDIFRDSNIDESLLSMLDSQPDDWGEPFVLRMLVLLLMTGGCYGVQLLLERQQMAAEEAAEFVARESQLHSAGRLAAEFAHQIKNPLAIINNAAFSLQRSIREGKTDAARQIEIIQEEVARADRVITQITGYAQLSEGRVERLDVVDELERAIAQVFPTAVPTRIKIHRKFASHFPPLLMQRGHLSEILVNLLQNARDALGQQGNIFVTADCRRDYSIEISVRDDGPGIPPDKTERIFEAYYTTKVKGTGLGLAIVKHNIELYGGTVRVESKLWPRRGIHPTLPGQSTDEVVENMSVPLPPVLVVDDEKNMRLSLQKVLEDEGYAARPVESAEEALELLAREEFFMIITDARLGGMSGYDFLARARSQWPELPVLMITAYATPKLAVEAIKAGAMDYVAKPFAPEELLHAVARCAERHRLLRENAALRSRAGETVTLDQIVGESAGILELRKLIQTVAQTDARVLILGESGTGKELVAGALHHLSRRRDANYVRINCAAIPETLLESELFGHEKGAFTGALKQKPGRVEEADGGTIFLDEIADMSKPLQAKLLRFLEDGTFTRVGGTQELRVNVRLIAATNRDLAQAIADGLFREDLFHRLNVVQIQLPPLRERGEDVLLLADYFLKLFRTAMTKNVEGLAPAAREKLLQHRWPGNIRELRNAIERALILETTHEIQPASLPDFQLEARLSQGAPIRPVLEESLDDALIRIERELIARVLEQSDFNLTRTAERLKLSRHSLRYRMQRLNMQFGDSAANEP